MHVKGFILEDDQGREFVVGCERPYAQLGQKFFLRGWQRRRLVPLHYTDRELRQIVGGVLVTLDELFQSLPRFVENREADVPTSRVESVGNIGDVSV
jgi:hypothetical protein